MNEQTLVDGPDAVVRNVKMAQRRQVGDIRRNVHEPVAVERDLAEGGNQESSGLDDGETIVAEVEGLDPSSVAKYVVINPLNGALVDT